MENEQKETEETQQNETAKCLIEADQDQDDEPGECGEENMVVPPDGGFGWVIVAVAFLSGVVVDGIIFSFGIVFPEVLREFGEGPSQTAWVGSVLAGTYLLVGPIVSALANYFGCRQVAIAGSFLGGIAFIACFFANSIGYLIVLYGFIGGLGFGCVYLPPIVMVSYYFEKKRAFATGIAVCGSGVGTFIMSPVTQLLIDLYGWRGMILIQAGIILNCAAICGFLRPLEPPKPKPRKRVEKRHSGEEEESPSHKRIQFSLRKKPKSVPLLQRMKEARAALYDSDSSMQSDNEEKDKTSLTVTNSNRPPLQDGVVPRSTGNNPQVGNSATVNCDSVDAPNSDSNENYLNRTRSSGVTNGGTIISDQKVVRRIKNGVSDRPNSCPDVKAVSVSQPQLGMALHRNSLRRQSALEPITEHAVSGQKGPWYFSLMNSPERRSALPKATPENLSRPFYRKDIFFSGSLLRIPEYTSASDVREYRRKVTYHPDHDSVDAKSEDSYDMKGTFKAMLDLSLLKSPVLVLICISGFLTFLGLFVPFVYVADFAQTTGTSKENAAFVLSIIGIFNTVGRIICGWISDQPWAKAINIYIGALIVSGGATALAPFCTIYPLQIVYGIVFGFALACFVSLRSIVLVELLGLDKLTNAFGLTMLFQGTASLFGSPLAGFLYGSTGSYNYSFYTAGCIMFLSGAMMIPVPYVARWEERRVKLKQGQGATSKNDIPLHDNSV